MKTPAEGQLVVRPAREEDLDALLTLLQDVPDSITSMQPKRDFLLRKIHDSLRSFYPFVIEPGPEKYFFVLEDRENRRLAGTCAISARTGGYEPNYTYEIRTHHFRHQALGIETEIRELHLRLDHEGPSELGGLFLHPDYRGCGIGGTLSRSRLLFAKAFPERFTARIMTEFRGVVTPEKVVPFWEALGRHFFVRDFFTMDQTSAVSRKDFIHDLMPRHPIYINLLPETAQACIGRPHPAAEPAVGILEKEGFRYVHRVDIFDAGPIYEAALAETAACRESRRLRVARITKKLPGRGIRTGTITNNDLDFRAVTGTVSIQKGEAVLTESLAEALLVDPGQEIQLLSSSKKPKK